MKGWLIKMNNDYLKNRRPSNHGTHTKYIYLFAFWGHVFFVPLFAFLGNSIVFYNNLLCIGIDVLCLHLNKKELYKTSTFLFVLGITYHATYCIIAFGAGNALEFYYITLTAIIILSNWSLLHKIAGITLQFVISIMMFHYVHHYPPITPIRESVHILFHHMFLFSNIFAIAYLCFFFMHTVDLAEKSLLKQAKTDCLTGLLNRGAFMEALQAEINRPDRNKEGLGIIIADIDHFKKINDTWGHLAGDEVIQKIASTLSSELRENDTIARYGGEEFVVFFPATSLASVHSIAERMRSKVEHLELHYEDSLIPVTMSFGVVFEKENIRDYSLDSFLKSADDMLYRAKAEGRNLVITQST